MNREEYTFYREWLERLEYKAPTIAANEFETQPGERRLLVYGYNFKRDTLRVWIDSDEGIGVQWKDEEIKWAFEWPVSALFPSKRAYPDRTDQKFAMLMAERYEYPISFTTPAGDWK